MAQKEGYRSRAAYKILEIHEKTGILQKNALVVDLGAAPGGWSQVAAKSCARVVASDILPMDHLENVEFIQGDFREEAVFNAIMDALGGQKVDVVLSDMAPNTSGFAAVDQPRMMYLCELAVDFALASLKDGGALVMKVFEGQGTSELRAATQKQFSKVKSLKPAASRPRSKEIYWILIK